MSVTLSGGQGHVITVSFSHVYSKRRLLSTGTAIAMIFREKIKRWRSGGVVQDVVGWWVKKPELPDLNKVNFLAIWPVFRSEGEALKACATRVKKLYFYCLVSKLQ